MEDDDAREIKQAPVPTLFFYKLAARKLPGLNIFRHKVWLTLKKSLKYQE